MTTIDRAAPAGGASPPVDAERERALMRRILALSEDVSRYLEESLGAPPGEIDLIGVGLLTRAAHRGLTPEARMCELQALLRRWVRDPAAGRRPSRVAAFRAPA